MTSPLALKNWFPFLNWGKQYNQKILLADLIAAAVVTLMLIPQSLAYALLAGLPPEVGLYASMAPLVLYALMGTSRALAVGPAAVTSLMTAASLGSLGLQGPEQYIQAALLLALMSGAIMFLMGVGRLGFLANFLSHPVVSGFVSASGILIAASQLRHILGIHLHGETLVELVPQLFQQVSHFHFITSLIGFSVILLLVIARKWLKKALMSLGLTKDIADIFVKAAPVVVLLLSILVSSLFELSLKGVKVVGHVPAGMPSFTLPALTSTTVSWIHSLWIPALLISLVGFVESVSVGQSLAAKSRESIDPNAELRALGLSNLGSGLTGGFPVTGGFSRSVVNYDAGARTPAAGIFTAVGLALAALFLTPWLFHLPQATLAATIMVAVLSLVDFSVFKRTWHYAKADFSALFFTFSLTLLVGVEVGLIAGVSTSLVLLLYRTSRPHIAVVGQVAGTEHYRNVLRHSVIEHASVLGLRVDESLYFANSRFLEESIASAVTQHADIKHVVLLCSAINDIDASALESLETINHRLLDSGVLFHLSEVKGPVMDRLKRSHFFEELSGGIYLSHHQAVTELTKE